MKKVGSVALGIVVIGVLVWLAVFVIKIAILLLPIALIALVGYVAYKSLRGKSIL